MSRASPKMRNIARRLTRYEAGGDKTSTEPETGAGRVCERLGPQLATFMGSGGFHALLMRALALASVEVPSLRTLQVNGDHTLQSRDGRAARVEPDEMEEGRVVLTAQLLGLLAAFIGESLTLRMLKDVWPNVSLDDLELEIGDKNEKEQ